MLKEMLGEMWNDYLKINPEAARIFASFAEQGDKVFNDHIALRTFNHPRLGIEQMARVFKLMGYVEKKDYVFKEKKLYAKHYEHSDTTLPKIFISELELEKCSTFVRNFVYGLVEKIPEKFYYRNDISYAGRPWDISFSEYSKLAEESEYASWVAAHGFRPNHFTVSVNDLTSFKSLAEVNDFLTSRGFFLNSSGGVIKGGPHEFLEQSSTMASQIPVTFSDGVHSIPGCYYEFAKRYSMSNGELYQGFVAASADKIFESTNKLGKK